MHSSLSELQFRSFAKHWAHIQTGSLKTTYLESKEVGIRGLGPDKNHPWLSRYEELRNESGVDLKRGFSVSKPHHSRFSTPHIEKDMDGFCRDPTPESRPPWIPGMSFEWIPVSQLLISREFWRILGRVSFAKKTKKNNSPLYSFDMERNPNTIYLFEKLSPRSFQRCYLSV